MNNKILNMYKIFKNSFIFKYYFFFFNDVSIMKTYNCILYCLLCCQYYNIALSLTS